jgi:hypothetical protein
VLTLIFASRWSADVVIVCHVVIPTVKIKIAACKASAEPNVFEQEPVFPAKMPQPQRCIGESALCLAVGDGNSARNGTIL